MSDDLMPSWAKAKQYKSGDLVPPPINKKGTSSPQANASHLPEGISSAVGSYKTIGYLCLIKGTCGAGKKEVQVRRR
jgi:hypothetical protein